MDYLPGIRVMTNSGEFTIFEENNLFSLREAMKRGGISLDNFPPTNTLKILRPKNFVMRAIVHKMPENIFTDVGDKISGFVTLVRMQPRSRSKISGNVCWEEITRWQF